MKNRKRFWIMVAGAVIVGILLFNLGVNLLLKTQLPIYIKKNTAYKVTYKTLDVNILTGNILATAVSVDTRNSADKSKIGIDGTVDTLTVSRLSLVDVLVNKRLNSRSIFLKKPNLRLTFAKPADAGVGKRKNPAAFRNIDIQDGNISIFRYDAKKIFSVKNLALHVENLQLTEKSVERKLPVVFDKYNLEGERFFYRPDNIYAFTAGKITTSNAKMLVSNFKMVPLLPIKLFKKYFPEKKNLVAFQAQEMEFTDMALSGNRIALSNVRFEHPVLEIQQAAKAKVQKKKPFTYDVQLQNVLFKNASAKIISPDGNTKFYVGRLDVVANEVVINQKTTDGNIPFTWQKYKVSGSDINFYTPLQVVKAGSFALTPTVFDMVNVLAQPLAKSADKTLFDISGKRITLRINNWKFVEKKLKLDVDAILLDKINAKIYVANGNNDKRKPNFSGIEFPLSVKKIDLRNSDVIYVKDGNDLALSGVDAAAFNIEMNENTVKNSIPFRSGKWNIAAHGLRYHAGQFYGITSGTVKADGNSVDISGFALLPRVSRAEFIRTIPREKDLYTIRAGHIALRGAANLLEQHKSITAQSLQLTDVNANIFRSKIPPDDTSEKPMYSSLLRSVKFPLYIAETQIKNSVLVYEEDKPDNNAPGKLIFGNFNLNAKNINSAKMKGRPTAVPISISCRFMNASPMSVKWNFDTADTSDAFAISGNISDLPASRINPFINPYMNLTATGLIQRLVFNFKGNKAALSGKFNLKHKDLKVSVLNKETKKKNKFLTALVNLVVRTDSGSFPESVTVDRVERNPTKSFFNFFWNGIQDGLKKTLLTRSAVKAAETIKKK